MSEKQAAPPGWDLPPTMPLLFAMAALMPVTFAICTPLFGLHG